MNPNPCADCRVKPASIGAGFNILCKPCLMLKYNKKCNEQNCFSCENIYCEGKLLNNCRMNTVLTPRQVSYNITFTGHIFITSLCPNCYFGVGKGTQYMVRKKSIHKPKNLMTTTYKTSPKKDQDINERIQKILSILKNEPKK